jgi:hypothetical protein
MRNTHEISVILVLVSLLASGCFAVRHSYQGDKFLTSDPDVPGLTTRAVKHFQVRDRQFFWLHGGIPVGEPLNGAALAAREAEGHAGVVNLRIWEGQDLRDTVISHGPCLLTLLCGYWSVVVEGDVVDVAAE